MSIITVLVSRNCDIKFKNMKQLCEFDSTDGLSRLISRPSESSVFLSIFILNNIKFRWVIFNSEDFSQQRSRQEFDMSGEQMNWKKRD